MPCLAVATAKQTACSYAWLKVSVSWPDAQSPGLFSDLRKWLDVTPFMVASRSAAIVGGGADGRGWIRGASSGATRVELIVRSWNCLQRAPLSATVRPLAPPRGRSLKPLRAGLTAS